MRVGCVVRPDGSFAAGRGTSEWEILVLVSWVLGFGFCDGDGDGDGEDVERVSLVVRMVREAVLFKSQSSILSHGLLCSTRFSAQSHLCVMVSGLCCTARSGGRGTVNEFHASQCLDKSLYRR